MYVEWIACNITWWFLEVPIDVAYGMNLVVNIFIHTRRIQQKRKGRQSIIVLKETFAVLWFYDDMYDSVPGTLDS